MLLQVDPSAGEAVLHAQALPLTPCAPRKFSILLEPRFSHLYNDRIGPEGPENIFLLKDPRIHSFSIVRTSVVLLSRDTAVIKRDKYCTLIKLASKGGASDKENK